MGGQSSQQQQAQQTTQSAPWGPAQPLLQGVLNQAQTDLLPNAAPNANALSAIGQLTQNAQQPNPYAASIGSYATNLLGGGGANDQAGNIAGNLNTYQQQLAPYANGSQVGQISPQLQSLLDTIRNDVGTSINSQFAGAGRDLSGINQQAYGRGIAQGEAAPLLNQYNQDIQNQLTAAGSLYGAGNTTAGALTALGQTGLANQGQGVDAANQAFAAQNAQPNALLNASQLPFQTQGANLGLLAQLGIPIAGLGGTSVKQGDATTTSNPSFLNQAQGWAGVLGSLFGKR